MSIIGLCGLIGSGKDTVANILNYKKMAFASHLKDVTAIMFDWPRNLLEGDTDESRTWRETPDKDWSEMFGFPWTPRSALQIMGTEAVRKNIHDQFWALYLKRKLINSTVNIVITDVRFPNEIVMLKSLGADIYRVKRGDDPEWVKSFPKNQNSTILMNAWNRKFPSVHPSEYLWLDTEFTDVINNDGTIDDLKIEVDKKILTRYNG